MNPDTYDELMADQARALLTEPKPATKNWEGHYYQIRFKRISDADWQEDLRADTLPTATSISSVLNRSKSIKTAYVVEREADGTWVRNW